jgi:hypothetical protein
MPRIPLSRQVVALASRLRSGKSAGTQPEPTLEPGERELYRTEIEGMSRRIVERHSQLTGPAACTVTNRRLLVCAPLRQQLEIPLGTLLTAYAHRDLARLQSYWVALHEHRSDFSDRRGTICLSCSSNRESQELAWQIRDALHAGSEHRHVG